MVGYTLNCWFYEFYEPDYSYYDLLSLITLPVIEIPFFLFVCLVFWYLCMYEQLDENTKMIQIVVGNFYSLCVVPEKENRSY